MELSIDELRSLHDAVVQNQHVKAFYNRFPRTQLCGSGNREVSTKMLRQAADKQQLVYQMQKTHLFGVSTDNNFGTTFTNAAIEWLLRKYEACGIAVESLPAEIEESPYSCPDVCIQ